MLPYLITQTLVRTKCGRLDTVATVRVAVVALGMVGREENGWRAEVGVALLFHTGANIFEVDVVDGLEVGIGPSE